MINVMTTPHKVRRSAEQYIHIVKTKNAKLLCLINVDGDMCMNDVGAGIHFYSHVFEFELQFNRL